MVETITNKTKSEMTSDISKHYTNTKPEDCGCTVCMVRLIIESNLVK